MIRLERYKFEIRIEQTNEVKELDMVFLVDGVRMNESALIEQIKRKLNKESEAHSYKIISCIRQNRSIDQTSRM